jgi:hypothetical protein
MRKLLVILGVVLLAGVTAADTITWNFDSAADLDDFDYTSGVTVGSDAFGSWVDLESSGGSFEYMTSYVKAVPSASEWTLIKTSFSEVWDVPSNEDFPMFGFMGAEVDGDDDPIDFIQIEANPHRQLEIFMRSNGGDEQYLTIENKSYWENGAEWWLYWKTGQVYVLGNGGYILFNSNVDTVDSFGTAWAIPTVPMHVSAEVGENGGLSFDDLELQGVIVPEPGTVLVLGLGGFILRKRRK